MTRLLSAIGKAASFTAKGAAVTFGSTVFSCAAACSIEKGANRMIFKYCPEKFANVEAASGITQEELDFVHFHYRGGIVAAASRDTGEPSMETETNEPTELFLFRSDDSLDDSCAEKSTEDFSPNGQVKSEDQREESAIEKFWAEGEDTAAKYISMIPVILPRQEILACSMTS